MIKALLISLLAAAQAPAPTPAGTFYGNYFVVGRPNDRLCQLAWKADAGKFIKAEYTLRDGSSLTFSSQTGPASGTSEALDIDFFDDGGHRHTVWSGVVFTVTRNALGTYVYHSPELGTPLQSRLIRSKKLSLSNKNGELLSASLIGSEKAVDAFVACTGAGIGLLVDSEPLRIYQDDCDANSKKLRFHPEVLTQPSRSASGAPAPNLPLAPTPFVAPPATTVAPAFGGTKPVFLNLPDVITADDYPATAAKTGAIGAVRYRVSISSQGRATGCSILQTSGDAALDTQACGLIYQRGKFAPAKDAKGRPVDGAYEARVVWRLED